MNEEEQHKGQKTEKVIWEKGEKQPIQTKYLLDHTARTTYGKEAICCNKQSPDFFIGIYWYT